MDYSGLIGGISGVAGSLINYGLQDQINDDNIDNQWQMFRENQRYQNDQNIKMYSTLRKSLEGAGLNVNSAFGGYPTTTAPSSPMASKVAPQVDTVGIAQLLQNAPLIDAQARKDNADAKAQEIENARKSSEDAMLYNLDILSNVSESDNVSELPELKKAPFNAGTLKALRDYNLFHGEQSEVEKNVAKNTLEKLVAEGQIKDNEVISSLVRLPVPTFNKIFNEVLLVAQQSATLKSQEGLNVSQTELNDLEQEITRNSNIHELITKYLGNGAVADAVHALVMLVGAFTGNMHLGVKLGKSPSRSGSSSKK